MPSFRYGNVLDYMHCDYFLFTGNSYIKNNGALVMGRGLARSIRDRIPGIDLTIGNLIDHMSTYGIVFANELGVFQVKHHFKDSASLKLVEYSTHMLRDFALKRPDKEIYMNFPAIGYGRLNIEHVMPIIECLPDNVNIWRFKS